MVSSVKLDIAGRSSLGHRGQHGQRRMACSSRKLVVAKAQTDASNCTSGQNRRAFLGSLAAGAVAATLLVSPPAQAGPFLSATGGKGVLAEKEQELYKLRQELEGEARMQIEAERAMLEEEGRQSAIGKLCATPFGIDIVGITEFIALVGALVGGITARQRKAELERLNEQLRKINMGLRQQARAGTVYAPGLTYLPPMTGTDGNGNGSSSPSSSPAAEPEVARPRPVTATITLPKPSTSERTLLSMEEDEMSADQIQCRDALRAGKRFLKEANGAAAMVRFEKALMLSKALGDKVQERRAIRGLAASSRLQGQYRTAIGHLERVLEISKEMNEYTGDADAFGTIADCYTDLGDLEKAAEFYDKYIYAMNKDGPV